MRDDRNRYRELYGDLYDHDFYGWTRIQAKQLRSGFWVALDMPHLAEEIEDLGKRERRAVESNLERVLLHLLKWAYQPARRGRSWRRSLLQARHRLARLLRDSPSFKRFMPRMVAEAYAHARRLAAIETDLPEATFPPKCRWSQAQILDEQFLPEPEGNHG
jgi:Domain of unknown function DUF29